MKRTEMDELQEAYARKDPFIMELLRISKERLKKFWAKAFHYLVGASVLALFIGLILFYLIVELNVGISYYENS